MRAASIGTRAGDRGGLLGGGRRLNCPWAGAGAVMNRWLATGTPPRRGRRGSSSVVTVACIIASERKSAAQQKKKKKVKGYYGKRNFREI